MECNLVWNHTRDRVCAAIRLVLFWPAFPLTPYLFSCVPWASRTEVSVRKFLACVMNSEGKPPGKTKGKGFNWVIYNEIRPWLTVQWCKRSAKRVYLLSVEFQPGQNLDQWKMVLKDRNFHVGTSTCFCSFFFNVWLTTSVASVVVTYINIADISFTTDHLNIAVAILHEMP